MKEQENKKIEALVDKMMNGVDLETPSLDFTATIMSQVEALAVSKVTPQQPLISKLGWSIIAITIIAIIVYAFIGGFANETTHSLFNNTYDYSVLHNNVISQFLSGIVISKTVLYSIVLFGAMLFIQIPLLKYYFNKRLEV